MAIKKKHIAIGLIILLPIIGAHSCQYYDKKHWKESFPEPLKMEKMLVYETGCDGFWCAGGVIVQMSEKDATAIIGGGAQYLNSLPDIAANGRRHIHEWKLVDKNKFVNRYFSSEEKSEYKTNLSLSLIHI